MMMLAMSRDDLNLDLDLDLNELPAEFDHDDSVSGLEDLRQIMLQHRIVFNNQVRELHRLYWTQKNLMNEVEMGQMQSESAQMRIIEGSIGDVWMGGDNFKTDSMQDDVVVDWELKESSWDESISHCDRSDKIHADSKINVCYRGVDLNVPPVIDLEAPLDASTRSSLDFGIHAYDIEDTSGPQVSVLTDIGSVSRLQKCSASLLLSEDSHLDHQKGKELLENTGHINSGFAGLNHSGGSQLSSIQTQKQQLPHKILQIDLNLSADDESASLLPDHPKLFPSPSTSSSVVYSGEMWRELSSQVQKDSLPGQRLQVCISPNKPDAAIIGSENLAGCKNVHPPSKQDSLYSRGSNCGKNILDEKILESTVEGSVECYRCLGETCACMSRGGNQNSTNLTILSFKNGTQAKKVNSYPSCAENNAESFSSKQDSRETSRNDSEENSLHGSTTIINQATNKEKQPCDNGSDGDALSSHATNVHEAQLDEFESSIDEHKPDQLENSICSIGDNSPSSSPENMLNAELLAGPSSNNLDPRQLCVKHVTIGKASKSVFIHGQHCTDEISEQHAGQPALAQELEHTIKKAAETLILFYSANSASPNYTSSDEEDQTGYNIGVEQPQFSLDSFEKQTLKLEEIKDDCSSIPDRQQFHSEAVNYACVTKLRRGRGRGKALRDFQKDVLPGLISLSRHEIREDIHTIQYQMKRNEPHKTTEETARVPARSRRSRLRC